MSGEKPHVFFSPDGTGEPDVFVTVDAPTGVTYGEQCMGLACDQREVEGFLIPTFADGELLITLLQALPRLAPRHPPGGMGGGRR